MDANNSIRYRVLVYHRSVARGGIHQSLLDEKLEMISSLDFLQFTIHNHDSAKSTIQKHEPENLNELWFCLAGNIIIKYYSIIIIHINIEYTVFNQIYYIY